jgi:hypothetical protein
MGRYAFGYRQVAVAAVAGVLTLGLGLQAALAARGDWQVGKDRLPPEWSLVTAVPAASGYRVMWIGRLSGEPFVPPGGDPVGTLHVGDTSVRFGLTGEDGPSSLDDGRDERGPGYGYLERAIGEIVSGNTVHGGALLAPLAVRFVVASSHDLPAAARLGLERQVDLDLVHSGGLIIFRNSRALPEASFSGQAAYAEAPLRGIAEAARLPAPDVTRMKPTPAGFVGPVHGAGAVLLADQYAGGWRAGGGKARVAPQRIFGWAMRFPVSARGRVTLNPPGQTPRRVEIAIVALVWLLALWITRRPSSA